METRTTRYLLTILSTILCGLPGLALMCLGTLGTIVAWLPDESGGLGTSEAVIVTLMALGMLCAGAIGVFIPLAAGFWAYRSRTSIAAAASDIGPLPEAF